MWKVSIEFNRKLSFRSDKINLTQKVVRYFQLRKLNTHFIGKLFEYADNFTFLSMLEITDFIIRFA